MNQERINRIIELGEEPDRRLIILHFGISETEKSGIPVSGPLLVANPDANGFNHQDVQELLNKELGPAYHQLVASTPDPHAARTIIRASCEADIRGCQVRFPAYQMTIISSEGRTVTTRNHRGENLYELWTSHSLNVEVTTVRLRGGVEFLIPNSNHTSFRSKY